MHADGDAQCADAVNRPELENQTQIESEETVSLAWLRQAQGSPGPSLHSSL